MRAGFRRPKARRTRRSWSSFRNKDRKDAARNESCGPRFLLGSGGFAGEELPAKAQERQSDQTAGEEEHRARFWHLTDPAGGAKRLVLSEAIPAALRPKE